MDEEAAQAEDGGAGRAPAPGGLRLVQRFLNTHDVESGVDELGDPVAATAWLRSAALLAHQEAVDAAGLERLHAVRDGLRALVLANNGEPAEAGAIERLDREAARAPLAVSFDAEGGPAVAPAADGVDGAVARLLAEVHVAAVLGTWPRLKACREHSCQWAFFDSSKNRSGKWCVMAVCGNRAKARAYRARSRR